MPASEELKGLVSRLPDPDQNGTYANLDLDKVQRIEWVAAGLEMLGREAVLGLIDLLVEPGKGDDVKPRFALHLLAVRATRPGKERIRAEFSRAVASQLGGGRPKAVQAYLIERLQWTGTGAVVEPLGKALVDPELCDPAARALVAIREGAAEQLLQALPKVRGASRRSLITKLGMLKAREAGDALRQALADSDPETRVAAAWGLARIADASAADGLDLFELLLALLNCAEVHAGWERINETDACLALAENLATAGKKDAAAGIYAHLAKTRRDPSERHVRAAAERGLAALGQTSAGGSDEEGFRPLFDGKSFAGWKVGENTPKSWRIESGLLVLTGGSNHLFTQGEFADFILRLQWRAAKKGYNSGLFVRGRQIQLADGQAGMLFASKSAPGVPQLHNPPGQWNEWEVTCVGRKLSLKVNGKPAWEIDDFKPARGPLGIEAEGQPIDFRHIRIKTLAK